MPKPRLYHVRGDLEACLLNLIARAGSFPDSHLSIVSNDRSNYYGLVDDTYLNAETHDTEEGHMRLVLRVTDAELQSIARIFDTIQGDLFDPPKTTI